MITDDEVDALLRAHGEIDYVVGADGLDDAIAASAAYRDAPGGRFDRLREAFFLDGDDLDLLLLSLAPEISAGYGKIFVYLNDNLNQAYLTVDLATRVLRQERRQRLSLQSRLLPGSPLIQNRLLLLNPPESADTHTSRRVHPSGRLLRWILKGAAIGNAEETKRIDTSRAPFIPASATARIKELGRALNSEITTVIVGGTDGMREGVAMEIARFCDRPLVRIDMERCKHYLENPFELARDLRLEGAIPYIVNVPSADDEPQLRLQMMGVGTALATLPYPICVGGLERKAVATMLGADRPDVTVPVGKSTMEERETAWGDALELRGWDRTKAYDVAERFYSIGGTTIERVLDRANAESGGLEPSDELIWSSCREAARPEFSGLAEVIIPRYSYEDLILPPKIMKQLKHLEQYLAQQEKVYFKWGAAKVRRRGFGLKALFSGGPGTGKTMCAEVIAGSLGLDMFKVDLSQVISRWVGETEKNLKVIFDAAEGGSSVILFDEGDALFGSRGETKSAQDKFANQEVAFLLQRIESFEGCIIITTNLQENIDEAFLRRFGAVVEFPMPTPSERLQLWQRSIPPGAPRDPNLDLEYVSKQFNVAGGSIINAAINACIHAASQDRAVGMDHILVAIARELYKSGKQINRVHFGEYYDVVAEIF